jgi:hypothetical protein
MPRSANKPAAVSAARLGFDFDGVIADTAEAFLRLACEEHGLCGFRLEEITRFEVEQCLDMSAETAAAIFGSILADSLGVGLKPMPGALEVLTELAETAGTVTVITARPRLQPVLDWFACHLPPSALQAVRVVAMGDHDDRAETCQQLHAAGIQPLVFRQPWNQHCRHLPAVSSWREIRELCFQGCA